ncbi:MAG: peptidoglycan-binding protein [Clostridia bacterium]|nr:peptidoglycan-binding protein [Clostridia bacterium]
MRAAVLIWVFLLCLCLPCAAETKIEPAYPVPQYIEKLLEIAVNELGYTEKNGYSKYGEWAGNPQAQWCAEYLCWCVDQVDQALGTKLLKKVYPMYSGQNVGLRWFLKQGRYVARNGHVEEWGSQWYVGEEETLSSGSYVPQPGDWVFYTVDGINTSHVAMVEYCTVDEKGVIRAHVLEGNLPDRVQRNSHELKDPRVLGYGTPRDIVDTVMRYGCEGVKVQSLQDKLVYLGYLDQQYATGFYGPSTTQAVMKFQQDTGKEPTGIANHHTQLTLSEVYAVKYWNDDSNFQVVSDEAGG